MKKSRKSVLRKPPASRGKQVADRTTVVEKFRKAFSIALLAGYGVGLKSQARCKSTCNFVERRARAIELRPRSSLKEYKSAVTQIKLMLMEDKDIPRSLLGRVLPRAYTCKKMKRDEITQFLRINRALPKVPVEKKDLEDHFRRLSTAFTREVPQRVEEVIDQIPFWEVDESLGVSRPSDFLSNSSCLESNRKKGGRSALLTKSRIKLGKIVSAESGLTRVDREAEELARVMGKDRRGRSTISYDCVPIALPELGAKVRIVTKHCSHLVAKSHASRRLLWPLLTSSRNITTSDSISDPELGKISFREWKNQGSKWKVFSADLSAATDYLGWPAIRLVAERACIPFEHISPLTVDGKEVCRGTAMGLPSSWPVLSLIHYAVCAAVDPSHDFRIKGDDLIALWTDEMISDYYNLCEEVGFVPNKDKSAISTRWGIFCEVSYRRYGADLIRQKDFSIKSFVTGEPLAVEQWQMMIKYGANASILHRLSRVGYAHWFKMCGLAKVNPYLPRQMGGVGIIPKNLDRPLKGRDECVLNAVHNGVLPAEPDLVPAGQCQKVYTKYIRENIAFTAQGGSHFNQMVYKEHSGKFLFRGAFVDAINGQQDKRIVRCRDIVRQLSRLSKRILKQNHKRFPGTFKDAYQVIRRLMVTRSSKVLGLGATHWHFNSLIPGWPMEEIQPLYDQIANKQCDPRKCIPSLCQVIPEQVLYEIQEQQCDDSLRPDTNGGTE